MPQMKQQFEEVRVYEGVAERTGHVVDRSTVRGSKSVCQSVSELTRKYRREGDGVYYLVAGGWPEGTASLDLAAKWTTMG